MDKFRTLSTSINDAIAASQSEDDRQALKTVMQDALRQIETPHEVVWQMYLEPHSYAVLRTAIDFRIFHILAEGEQSAQTIASLCNTEKSLVIRLCRVLVAMGVLSETGIEAYENGRVGEALAGDPCLEGGAKFMFDLAANAIVKMPEVLREHRQNPQGQPIIFKRAFGEDQTVFSYLSSNPSSLSDFNNLMAGQRYGRKDWFEFFPVQEKLLDGFEGGPLLVDVGGAEGYELQCFKKTFPSAKGDLLLQDLPVVIDRIQDLDSDITRMKHDFFTPQPVKGSRAYYFRSIFHDWDDEKCRKILRALKPAMKPGYSKLLINDWIIPDRGAALYPSLLDINMMGFFSSMERTESQWKELLASEGFEVVKMWSIPGNEGCIEANLRM